MHACTQITKHIFTVIFKTQVEHLGKNAKLCICMNEIIWWGYKNQRMGACPQKKKGYMQNPNPYT